MYQSLALPCSAKAKRIEQTVTTIFLTKCYVFNNIFTILNVSLCCMIIMNQKIALTYTCMSLVSGQFLWLVWATVQFPCNASMWSGWLHKDSSLPHSFVFLHLRGRKFWSLQTYFLLLFSFNSELNFHGLYFKHHDPSGTGSECHWGIKKRQNTAFIVSVTRWAYWTLRSFLTDPKKWNL